MSPESLGRASAGSLSLGGPVAGTGSCYKGGDQSAGRGGNFCNGPVEGGLVDFRRCVEAAEFAYELQRGVMDLGFSGGRLEIEECLYVPAHNFTPLRYRVSLYQGAGYDEAHRLAQPFSAIPFHFGDCNRCLPVTKLGEQVTRDPDCLVCRCTKTGALWVAEYFSPEGDPLALATLTDVMGWQSQVQGIFQLHRRTLLRNPKPYNPSKNRA
jgi:hypothetical protein